jgi:hypothetical protein
MCIELLLGLLIAYKVDLMIMQNEMKSINTILNAVDKMHKRLLRGSITDPVMNVGGRWGWAGDLKGVFSLLLG